MFGIYMFFQFAKQPAKMLCIERNKLARWQSGHAEDCKSFYVGSIPARASNISIARANPTILRRRPAWPPTERNSPDRGSVCPVGTIEIAASWRAMRLIPIFADHRGRGERRLPPDGGRLRLMRRVGREHYVVAVAVNARRGG